MRKLILGVLLFIGVFPHVYSQNIRTFNTINFSTNILSEINNHSVSVGEMIQIKKILPFRILIAAQYTGKIVKKGYWPGKSNSNTGLTFKQNVFASNINFPIGGEIYFKSIGLGFIQEIANINFAKTFDSTKVEIPLNHELRTNKFSHIFSNENNLNSTLYLVYTLSDSFTLKLGVNRGNDVFKYYESSIKTGQFRKTDNSIFISIRTNIEK